MADTTILHYRTTEGRYPYRDWVESISDKKVRASILARVDRLSFGSFGDWKAVGEGVGVLRIHLGAGHRVFFGRQGHSVVILLCGGEKRSQDADIKQAKIYWKDYETRTKKPAGRGSAR